MRFAVIVFPGSNCDEDMHHAITVATGQPVDFVWHTADNLDIYDAVLLPGGFSYGDYLRCGAIASLAPVMHAVKQAAAAGKPVLGVCNGFQILLEAGLLPGAMSKNVTLRFSCSPTELTVVNAQTQFTSEYQPNQTISIPIAHGEGSYYCDAHTLQALEKNGQIVFRYCNNPNGSVADIAGIINPQGNVLGMMPHPERAVESLLGSHDGLGLFASMVANWRNRYATI